MDYFTRALIEAVLAGGLAGLVGVIVVVRDRAFFTMSLTHATFPGAVAAVLLGIPPVLGAAAASLGLVGIASGIGRMRAQGASVASGIMLTTGFALGMLLQSVSTTSVNVESFLTGSILATSNGQLVLTATVLAASALALLLFGRRVVFESFDAAGYRAAGQKPIVIEMVVLLMISSTVVTLMPVVGSILAVALIVAPAAAAKQLTRSTTGMFIVAPIIGIAAGVIGLLASRALEVSAGGAITLTAALLYLLALLPWRRFRSMVKTS